MCGIIGAVSYRDVSTLLLAGLQRLEYRGYDSAGIMVIDPDLQFIRYRAIGKVEQLEKLVQKKPLQGTIGIAHTRWATHGKPSEKNAHPHIANNEIALVHNGIIENNEILAKKLQERGCQFASETDSELVAHLISQQLKEHPQFLAAVQNALPELEGSYALGILDRHEPKQMIAVRYGSPLVIGLGEGENFIASDQLALLPLTKRFIYLEEGDIAIVQAEHIAIVDRNGKSVERPIIISDLNQETATKGTYPHFMLKEIFEQPDAVASILEGRLSLTRVLVEAFGPGANKLFKKVRRVHFAACGTSYHACLVAQYWLAEIANIPSQVDIASEFRYRKQVVEPNTLFVTVSQSGETADTLAALREAKKYNYLSTLSICNVPESSLVRESKLVLLTRAGPEIGVASTKAFTTQLTGLLMFAIALAQTQHTNLPHALQCVEILKSLPTKIEQTLQLADTIKEVARSLLYQHFVLFLGRGIHYPIAMEGALKLREISYIPAFACSAGELKHGTIAIIESSMTIIAIMPQDGLIAKIKSNLQEVLARFGKLIIISEEPTEISLSSGVEHLFNVPATDSIIAPIIYTLPLQLLAYHVAVFKGNDVDQPRNLAKSVTVE